MHTHIRLRPLRNRALLLVEAIVGCGVVIVSSRPSPADPASGRPNESEQADCVDCFDRRFAMEVTGNFEIDSANQQRIEGELAAWQRRQNEARAVKIQAENAVKFNTWHGTKILQSPNVAAGDRARVDQFAKLFGGDFPTPEARSNLFRKHFNGESEFKCIGWDASVSSVRAIDQGWEVTLRVRPSIMHPTGGISRTTQTCTETWLVAKDGKITLIQCVPDQFPVGGMIMMN